MTKEILLVEDYETAVELQDSLEDLGFQIMAIVEDIDEAVDIAAQECPLLTIINIESAGHDSAIKTSEKIMQLNSPVIYLTGEDTQTHYGLLKKSSGYGFINRNFDKLILKKQIEYAIRRFAIESEKINLAHGFIK